MSIQPLLARAQESSLRADKPKFDVGDTVDVLIRILEGDKERTQTFTGIIIAKRGAGSDEMFTVRRIVDGEGVERIFPINSPRIAEVVVKRRAVVRRAKLYYLRERIGSKAFTLKERTVAKKENVGRSRTRIKARKQKQAEAAAKGETTGTSKKAKAKRETKDTKKS